MNNETILFVTHKKSQCGVYEFGENIFNAIKSSQRYNFVKAECGSLNELNKHITKEHPHAIIYNYMPATMPWIASSKFRIIKNNIADIPVVQIGIIHSIVQDIADSARQCQKYIRSYPELANRLFDFYIAPDPTLLLKNPLVFKHGRPIQKYTNNYTIPDKITIGSFGFAKSGYEDLIRLVQNQFDEAEIRINIPFSSFEDLAGTRAKAIANNCREIIRKPGIKLSISHDYLDNDGLLDFLAQNTINIFLREGEGRGISSVIDYALSVNRPIAITNNNMFKHIINTKPSINVAENSLNEIIKNGTAPLMKYMSEWSYENLCWEYERILDNIFKEVSVRPRIGKIRKIIRSLRAFLDISGNRGTKTFGSSSNKKIWIDTTDCLYEDNYKETTKTINYEPIASEAISSFNMILNNNARKLYEPVVKHLLKLVPKTMAKKIPEANVQQAFVFDTVYRHLGDYEKPKVLSVGSFEDTASMSLIKMGVEVEEIDPMFNYYLQEFFTKPNVIKGSYDIIFATSVIEHDPNDESFMICVSELLAPNGIFVMTCDYKDGWKPGDPKPGCCERLYTKDDLESRLLTYMKNCRLIDEPNWEHTIPDFVFGDYDYSFATLVVKKEM